MSAVNSVNIETADKRRLRLWLRLLRTTRSIENKLRERLRSEFDTTLPRFDVLAVLYRSAEGLKMSRLSRELMVSNGNVTGLVDRLEAEGAVERRLVEGDRRAALVRLTPSGRSHFEVMAKVHENWVNELIGELKDDEVDLVMGLLTRVSPDREPGP